jgi:hypothetical protein
MVVWSWLICRLPACPAGGSALYLPPKLKRIACLMSLNRNTPMRLIIIAFACVLVSGCVGFSVDKMPRKTRFREISKPEDISAVFRNKGTVDDGASAPQLSSSIFPEINFSGTPDQIRFRNRPPSDLICEAISQGKVVASRELVQGRDFHIAGGGLQLVQKFPYSFLGEGVVGIEKYSLTLRLTESGDIVMMHRDSEVGMILFVLPMATVHAWDTVFKRVPEGADFRPRRDG